MTVFPTPLNNLQLRLGAPYTAGSGTVILAAGGGAALAAALAALGAPAISAAHPLRFTLIRAAALNAFGQVADPAGAAIYQAAGRSGDVLSGVSVREGTTDIDCAGGDVCAVLMTAGVLLEMQDAIGAVEAGLATVPTLQAAIDAMQAALDALEAGGGTGGGAGDLTYRHEQSTPVATATIAHNLGKHPSVTVVDTAGTEWLVSATHLDLNTVRLDFAGAMSFTAYFN